MQRPLRGASDEAGTRAVRHWGSERWCRSCVSLSGAHRANRVAERLQGLLGAFLSSELVVPTWLPWHRPVVGTARSVSKNSILRVCDDGGGLWPYRECRGD